MYKNANKRYTADANMEPKKLEPVASRTTGRRALGDITNSFATSEGAGSVKKPMLFAPSSQFISDAPAISATVMEDVESMDVDDRFYMNREADNIDARDGGNPLLCTAYVSEMYDHFLCQERELKVDPNYMLQQPHVNEKMRSILVDWLVEVHLKFKMVPETLYLTVNMIDRYLEVKQVRRSQLQLVGVSALLCAAKYEEIYPPDLRDLVYITDKAYDKREILLMESEILETLGYNLTVPTVHTFLCRHLKAAHADRAMVQMSCYLAERSLQEPSMLKWQPSIISAVCVFISRKSLKRHPWSPTLLQYTTWDEDDLAPCVEDMKSYLNSSATSASIQHAVLRKYSNSKFGSVAKYPLVM